MDSMKSAPEPDFAITHLLEAVAFDHELARQVAECFIALDNSLPRRLDDALAAHENRQAIDVAHEIKGMAAMLGARRLAAAAAAAELSMLPSAAATLHVEWRRVGQCLHQYLALGVTA
jgi:HPt (histidine-containing phosphotransfer) domain-containing protein